MPLRISDLSCVATGLSACSFVSRRTNSAGVTSVVVFQPSQALRLAALLFAFTSVACSAHAANRPGADLPWTTYEAESMKTTGVVLGPKYAPHELETEASGQKCVRLTTAGAFVEFTAQANANALVVRFNLPDSADGNGTTASLSL